MLQTYKENKYLVFCFDDGKTVKYDLSNGETIGKSGRVVKDICSQLRGYAVLDIINSFPDENYKNFLLFIDRNFINRTQKYSYGGRRYGSRLNYRVDRVKNVGTFLSRIKDYKRFEQIFACGLKNIDPNLRCELSDIPKPLIKICKQLDLFVEQKLIDTYKENPDIFNYLVKLGEDTFNCITSRDLRNILYYDYYAKQRFNNLINTYNYKISSLLTYIDNLMTYEALDGFSSVLSELTDYCRMMNEISPKYEKYPKNFLTTHKIATRNYNRLKETFEEAKFQNVIDKKLEYKHDSYRIVYPKSTKDIKEEAVQQNHCVASYIKDVIEGKTHILFLRDKDHLDSSLITLEVKNYKVVQARGKFNRETNPEEQAVINEYNKKLTRLKSRLDKLKAKQLADLKEKVKQHEKENIAC